MDETLTVARFREIFPEFSVEKFPDTKVLYGLELACEVYNGGPNAKYTLAAHFLSLEDAEGTGVSGGSPSVATLGTVLKQTVGRVSTAFVQMARTSTDSFYEQTPYGKRFLALRGRRRFSTRVF
jgi:hypothetical protein